MSSKRTFAERLPDARFVKALQDAGGDYYIVAKAHGVPAFRAFERWRKFYSMQADSPVLASLDGAVGVYHAGGQRLQQARRFQVENNKLRAENRVLNDLRNLHSSFLDALDAKPTEPAVKPAKRERDLPHHEWLFSDLHYGKVCEGYDARTARNRVRAYADAICAEQKRRKPTTTTLAFLGDLIENSAKHRDSRSGCEMDTAEQIVGAFRTIKDFISRILPRAGGCYAVGVTGNHENLLGGGSTMNFMGRAHASHIIYSLLKDEFGNKMHWEIPDGSYAVMGGAVYEHGDHTQPNDQSMAKQLAKRARQVAGDCDEPLTRYRQGDKHVAVVADAGNLVCNGAFYSDRAGTEFSGVHGYCSDPCQVGFTGNGEVRLVKF